MGNLRATTYRDPLVQRYAGARKVTDVVISDSDVEQIIFESEPRRTAASQAHTAPHDRESGTA